MTISVDLRKAHAHRTHGDITAIFTWMNDERALVLLPHRRAGAPWYVVMEGAAWTWNDQDPKNVATVARKGMKACEVLGIEPSPWNVRKIAGIITDALPDLIRMPSAPPKEYVKGSFGTMLLMADGKPMAGDDIRIEQEGVTYG